VGEKGNKMAIEFNTEKILVVDIDKVRPNPWNPKERDTEEYKMVLESIRVNGLRLPVIVRDNDGYEIIDGEQRYTACLDLDYPKVVIYNEGKMDDKRAKELTLWYQTQVPTEDIKLAELITDLHTNYDSMSIPYSEEDINNYLGLLDFDFDNFGKDKPEFEEEPRTLKVILTESQYQVVTNAIKQVRSKEGTDSDGRAIELICADYLSGAVDGDGTI
jgi:ParB/RepB/Spo0J family partition protein